MTDLDKMARDILDSIPDAAFGTAADFPGHAYVVLESEARYAIRAALLAAPPGYVLVPVVPTDEMAAIERLTAERDALQAQLDWTVRENDRLLDEGRDLAAMLAAAPEVK